MRKTGRRTRRRPAKKKRLIQKSVLFQNLFHVFVNRIHLFGPQVLGMCRAVGQIVIHNREQVYLLVLTFIGELEGVGRFFNFSVQDSQVVTVDNSLHCCYFLPSRVLVPFDDLIIADSSQNVNRFLEKKLRPFYGARWITCCAESESYER